MEHQVTKRNKAMYVSTGMRGGGVLHSIFSIWVQHAIKKWTQSDLRGQKDLKPMIKVN